MAKKTGTNGHEDDAELFQQMMEGVRPLQAEPRVAPAAKRQKTAKREPVSSPLTNPFAERELAPVVGAEENLLFARSGIQHRLIKQLKRGDIPPEAKLDLHGRTIAEAGQALSQFLHSAQQQALRCVLVVHGKGSRSAEGKPRLKAQVNQWLRDTPLVLAFCSAQIRHGGAGALYVLIKQSR